MLLKLPSRIIEFPRRPLLMGIVNVNDDSFCGDGTLDFEAAAGMAVGQIQVGADIIDIGAESARTNRAAIPVDEEIRRLLGFLERWEEICEQAKPRDEVQVWPPVLSVNTWRPEVAAEILPIREIEILNDMGGLPDNRNARLCAEVGSALLVMHGIGEPKVPHFHQRWDDVMASMENFFSEKLAMCGEAGLPEECVILDPGLDFAKQRDDNLTVMRDLERLKRFGRPLLLPVSRKTVIGETLGLTNPEDRDAGTIACISAGMLRGASIFRVHNVGSAWQAVKVLHALAGC